MAGLVSAPFIVFGAPRSGTTYLQSLIDSDPRVVLTNETRIFTWMHRSLREAIESDKAVARMKADVLAHLRQELPRTVRAFYADLAPEATFWGDKNPFYGTDDGVLETIDQLFPGARYVHLVRDGRDVVTSLHRRRGPDGKRWATFDHGHTLWLHSLEVANAHAERVGDRYFQLRYEDLIADDVGKVKEVFTHLGLVPSAETLEYAGQQQAERTPLSTPTRTLDDVGGSAWEDEWEPTDRLRSLDRLGDALVDLGYETVESLETLRRRTDAAVSRSSS